MQCSDCKWFYRDTRQTEYRRDNLCFCRRKGCFFSRNHRIGEGARIDPAQKACEWFEPVEDKN